MHIHILGICGTFMGSLAVLAKAAGHKVSGCDQHVYPPMSTQLREQGILLHEGYDAASLDDEPDLVIVGNAMSRGIPVVEALLERNIPYTSGPQWLGETLLQQRHVFAVSGTHGKTTTASMLTWVLADQGKQPGYLIGGVPQNFAVSASIGGDAYFVIEADEYDTAFFDKRSKFVHYRPNTLLINNMEFDHADIFDDITAIQRQFHHCVRIVPSSGRIIHPYNDDHVTTALAMGCWSPKTSFGVADGNGAAGGEWAAQLINADGSSFDVLHHGETVARVDWSCIGLHNVNNALAVIAAAGEAGITPSDAAASLSRFNGVKRRMELKGTVANVTVYDDFAHHPTAIATTLDGLRQKVGNDTILAVLEPRSNTMKMGVHDATLADSTQLADGVFWFLPKESALGAILPAEHAQFTDLNTLIQQLTDTCAQTVGTNACHIVCMSNGGFGGIHDKLLSSLENALN